MSLTLTETAVDAVRAIIAAQDAPATSGVRIVAEQVERGKYEFWLCVESQPADGDAVIEEDGARVFLGGAAAHLLDDKMLDARVDEGSNPGFVIANGP
jgi:Fe-S cluster assembly iron-binding protein IscA